MIITTKSLYLLSYIIVFIIDIILEIFFKNTKFYANYTKFTNKYDFFTLFFILFMSLFGIFTLFSSVFDITLIKVIFETYDIKLIDYATPEATSGNSINSLNNETTLTNTKVEVEKQHVNINNGNLHVKVPVQGLNSMAAAASSSGGGALAAAKVVRNMSGPPALKLLTGIAVMGGVQIGTAITANALNHITGDSSNNLSNSNDLTNKYGFLINSYTDKGINLLNDGFGDLLIKLYSEYPLSLLFELNRLINIEIIFMFMLINIFLIKKMNHVDFKSYLPDNKAGKIIEYIINRYIKTWSSISKYIVYLAIGMIIYSIILSKLVMVLISIA